MTIFAVDDGAISISADTQNLMVRIAFKAPPRKYVSDEEFTWAFKVTPERACQIMDAIHTALVDLAVAQHEKFDG